MENKVLTLEMGESLLTGITHVVPSQVLHTLGTIGTSLTFGAGYEWLFELLNSLWPPIMGGAFIIFLVRTVGAGYQLTLGNLASCVTAIKWSVIGLFFLTLIPKFLRIIVDVISNMAW